MDRVDGERLRREDSKEVLMLRNLGNKAASALGGLLGRPRGFVNRKKAKPQSGRRGRAQFEPLEPRRVLDSTVVFNEVMYNPAGDVDGSLEWVEFYNQLCVNTDVSDWLIEGGIDYRFPNGTVAPGRGYLVVAKDP